MKNNPKILNDLNDTYQKELARILKAKRLEQGKSLEDVSKGICSVSYLSRLENNQVKFQDPYLKMLFEKLEIDYDDLKMARKQHLFLDVIKKKLLGQTTQYKEMVNAIVGSNNFLDVERQLVTLYDTLMDNNYEEALLIMDHIDQCKFPFSNVERIFYMYLVVLYYYQTHQNNMAYRQIKVLKTYKIEDDVLKWSIFEISMQLHFDFGHYCTYLCDYIRFIKEAPTTYFANLMKVHKLKIIYLKAKENPDKIVEKFQNYALELNLSDDFIKENYYYHLSLIYLDNQKYETVLQTIGENILSPRIVKSVLIALNNVENPNAYYHLIKILNNFAFTKYDRLPKNMLEYTIYKINNVTINKLQNFLRTKLYNLLYENYENQSYSFILKELLKIDVKCSKYKDGCQLMFNYLNNLESKFIDN